MAYEKAIKANPKHYYLKDVLAHINYVKNTDSLTLQNQLKSVVGTYGPRTFWIENDRLFYKRGNDVKIELLPISKDRYMNMTKLRDHLAFTYEGNNVINSFLYQYETEKEEWIKYENENNMFKKNY